MQGMLGKAYNLNSQEVGTEGSGVQSQPWLHIEFEACLS